jgi:anaerobic magnesium-protoporphyrin IX monomethyl ester cyclase
LSYGYDRIWIADDVFTLHKDYVMGICDEIIRRNLKCQWECLSRADTFDPELSQQMKASGCARVFFGIESGSNDILHEMKKHLTVEQAASAIETAKKVGLNTGAFFILGYPGENDNTILQTIKLSNSLPIDYASYAFPYPFPGTGLYEKVKDRLLPKYWDLSSHNMMKHRLVFKSDFSEAKLKFALFKGNTQFKIRKYCRKHSFIPYGLFDKATELIFRLMK